MKADSRDQRTPITAKTLTDQDQTHSKRIMEGSPSNAENIKKGRPSQVQKDPKPKTPLTLIKSNSKLKSQKQYIHHTKNVRIANFGEDETGKPFVKLRIKVIDHIRTAIVPLEGFTNWKSSVFDLLNHYGAHLYSPAARSDLINRVQAIGYRRPLFTVATRLGWHGQDFVLPDYIISPTKHRIRLYLDPERPERFDRYRVGGTYRGWKQGSKLIKGNSRLILGSCVSLAGIVGPVLHTEPVFVSLVGDGESGKSAILVFAGSFWGRHTDPNMANTLGFGTPWDSTGFDIEKEALAVNHTVVLLDESRAYSTDNNLLITFVTTQVFRLERGFERGRGLAIHRRRSTHVSLLATSNISIEAAPRHVTLDDAVRGRWIEVPAPENGRGMYENLHGAPDVATFTGQLRSLARQHFGHAARKFITRLSAWLSTDKAGFLRWAERRRQFFLRSIPQTAEYGPSNGRIQQKFATLYAVGCSAVKFGVLPLNRKQVRKALMVCLNDHFLHVERERRQNPSHAMPNPLELLRQHIRQHPPVDLRTQLLPDIDAVNLAQSDGLLLKHAKRGDEFCISDSRLMDIVGGKARAQELKYALDLTGDIAKGEGVGVARFSVKRPIAQPAPKNRHRPNLIAIKASALGLAGN